MAKNFNYEANRGRGATLGDVNCTDKNDVIAFGSFSFWSSVVDGGVLGILQAGI